VGEGTEGDGEGDEGCAPNVQCDAIAIAGTCSLGIVSFCRFFLKKVLFVKATEETDGIAWLAWVWELLRGFAGEVGNLGHLQSNSLCHCVLASQKIEHTPSAFKI
jgi:hypothetical protein